MSEEALQTTLAGEHAALYLYGVLGGVTSASATPGLYATIRRGYDLHRSQRDALTRMLRDLGAVPVAAEPAYVVPSPLETSDDVARVGREIEQRCCATYAAAVAGTVGDQRSWCLYALSASALRRLELGDDPVALPGSEPA